MLARHGGRQAKPVIYAGYPPASANPGAAQCALGLAARAGYLRGMTTPGRPGETRDERADRNLVDLLQELRVATLGVQVLFGFLLGLPFTSHFSALHTWQRGLYVATLMLSSVSVVLLVAPVAYHRLLFRRHQLEHLIRAANSLAICGLVTVALAVACAVLLVTSYVLPGAPAVVLTVVISVLFATFWFALPVARRRRIEDQRTEDHADEPRMAEGQRDLASGHDRASQQTSKPAKSTRPGHPGGARWRRRDSSPRPSSRRTRCVSTRCSPMANGAR